MLELFTTNEYDNIIALKNGNNIYTYKTLKSKIAGVVENLKTKNKNVVILGENNYQFILLFWGAIFAKKNIYLISDKTKLKMLNIDYYLACDCNVKIENYDFKQIDIHKPLINFFTSGSSSEPKIITKSLFNLIKEGEDIGKEFNFKDKKYSVMSTTTMCHQFGLTFHLIFPMCSKYIIDTTPASYPENIDKENSILVSTPTFLNTVLKYNLQFKKEPEYIITAGSKLDEKVFEYLEKKSKMIEIYGSTETGIIAHKTHYNDDFNVFKNVQIDVDENFLNVKSGYFYENIAQINDKVELNKNSLKIKNRTDRVFKIYEKRISADEIETKLNKNEFVSESYIFKYKEKLACFCALSDKGKDYLIKNNISHLIKNLKQYLLKYSEITPQNWRFIDEIPKTETGKINKKFIEHIFNINISLPVILNRKISKNKIDYQIYFYKQANFYKGHFPSFQLTPGVVQLYLTKELANNHYGLDLGMGQWKRIKFSNIIKPDSIINLKLEKNEEKVSYEYYSEDKKYASGVFLQEQQYKIL